MKNERRSESDHASQKSKDYLKTTNLKMFYCQTISFEDIIVGFLL